MLKAYHDDPLLKFDVMLRLKAARISGELAQGGAGLWDENRFCGCAVGVLTRTNERPPYEQRFGLPVVLAWLTQGIFEDLPEPIALDFPERLMQAIPVGANLTGIFWRLLCATLKEYGFTETVDLTIEDLASLLRGGPLPFVRDDSCVAPRRLMRSAVRYALVSKKLEGGPDADQRMKSAIFNLLFLEEGAAALADRLISLVEAPQRTALPRKRASVFPDAQIRDVNADGRRRSRVVLA